MHVISAMKCTKNDSVRNRELSLARVSLKRLLEEDRRPLLEGWCVSSLMARALVLHDLRFIAVAPSSPSSICSSLHSSIVTSFL